MTTPRGTAPHPHPACTDPSICFASLVRLPFREKWTHCPLQPQFWEACTLNSALILCFKNDGNCAIFPFCRPKVIIRLSITNDTNQALSWKNLKVLCLCGAVKLPEILGKMHIPDKNLRALVKHLELFLRYLPVPACHDVHLTLHSHLRTPHPPNHQGNKLSAS